MALLSKLIQITQTASVISSGTGEDTAITGVGFQPKILIAFAVDGTADGINANAVQSLGAGTGSTTAQQVGSYYGQDNVAANTRQSVIDNHLVYIVGASQANNGVLDIKSLDSDGMTLTWLRSDGVQRKINILCLGGSDLTNVKTGYIAAKTTTGNQAYTGVGFQPDCVLFFTHQDDISAPPSWITSSAQRLTLGFAKSTTKRGSLSTRFGFNGANTQDAHYQRTNSALSMLLNATTVAAEADLVSFDADGFTLNYTTVEGTANVIQYIALKGLKVDVGNFLQKTSTGTQGITGVGFIPNTLILASAVETAQTTVQQTHSANALGMATSTTQRVATETTSKNGVSTTVKKSVLDSANIIKMVDPADGSTVKSAADLSSFDSGGFTLNWGTADAVAREILYLALGGRTIALTGTATASITEADIVAGGKTIILTLTGDTWVATGATFDAQRQNIINGLDSAQAEATGWDAEVKAKIPVTDVVRTSDTVVTITLSAEAGYNITATETITATIPATALTGGVAVVASPTFTVNPIVITKPRFRSLLGVGY
ncbi:MAG: hypothetical protein PHE73_08645 [Sulfurovaceae bacterium]|nr:hypothetical protein [Sulfurovaceae bacterium]